jgi:integrase/recombinase XerD
MKRDARNDTPNFWGYARNYLHDYMPKVRALSVKTIEAYRISLECYVDYLIGVEHIERKDIGFDHFERRFIKAWLAWMQQTKNYQPKTVNLRLTAVKAFLHYASSEDLRLVALHDAAKALKAPSPPRKPVEYLQQHETAAILAAVDGSSIKSRRNRMLLILLYESAARVSELTALTLGDVQLERPAHLTLTGKRNKSRIVPLDAETVEHLQVYLKEFHPRGANRPATRPLFNSHHYGEPARLSEDSVAAILKRAGDIARNTCPSIPAKLHCHLIRKTRAMDLYQQG